VRDRSEYARLVPGAAVVIVSYRTPDLTCRCLAAIRRARDDEALDLEMVVADNDSGDDTVPRVQAEHPWARLVVSDSNRGFAAGVNAGFRATEAPVVILINSDAEPHRGALAALVAHLASHLEAAVAVPQMVHPDGSPQASGFKRFPNLLTVFSDFCVVLGYPYAYSPARVRGGARVAWVSGAAMAIRRTAYDQVGPLDEGYFLYLEDTDWQERAAALGWAVDVVADVTCAHLVQGGGTDGIPTPAFVESVYRYLLARGRRAEAVDLVLASASAISVAALELVALLVPSRRAHTRRKAAAFRRVLTEVGNQRRRGART
jgi:N-acetylglucosaminyl-diphospho-decaprenol L-rhamnosyltransferase